jgi:hypothetical protein
MSRLDQSNLSARSFVNERTASECRQGVHGEGRKPERFESRIARGESRGRSLSPIIVAAAMMIEIASKRRMPEELHDSSVAGSNPVVCGNAGVAQW